MPNQENWQEEQFEEELDQEEKTDEDIFIQEKYYYEEAMKSRQDVWGNCWENYISTKDEEDNPYLSNLFLPKTHESVELLAAFLAGNNQKIECSPEGKGDTTKALLAEKLVDFQWRKEIKAHDHLITWLKQGILFGNGFIKLGWDEGKPWMEVIDVNNLLFDYYAKNLEESYSVIHKIPILLETVKNDKKYDKKVRQRLVSAKQPEEDPTNNYSEDDDSTQLARSGKNKKTIIYERWCLTENKMTTWGKTSNGWEKLRDIDCPYKDSDKKSFLPITKLRFKTNPLPSRGYDIGGVEQTIHIQKAFNKLMNEYFDNVELINNKQWITRRGAKLTPMDLERQPGGMIEVDDINEDIKPDEYSDIKTSLLEMIERLDNEFQQASMVVNLLKAMPSGETATEASLAQNNTQILLDLIERNIQEAMSEVGMKLLYLNQQYLTEKKVLKIDENDEEFVYATFKPSVLKAKYDIRITADRPNEFSKEIKQKQVLDLMSIASRDPYLQQTQPQFMTRLIKYWLEETGFGDVDYLFQSSDQQAAIPPQTAAQGPGGGQMARRGQATPDLQKQLQSLIK